MTYFLPTIQITNDGMMLNRNPSAALYITLDVFVQVWYSMIFSPNKCLTKDTAADDNIQKLN